MPTSKTGPTDQELDVSIAVMLKAGVTLAALVVLAGGAMLLTTSPAPPGYRHFHAAGPALSTLPGIFRGAIHRDPRAIIQLGLVLLIATPVVRVVFCVIGFARQRNRLYTAIGGIVLAVLLYSLTKGAN